jgi:hypothetical protein
MTAIERAARVSALLDEAKEELGRPRFSVSFEEARVRATNKITDAQNILIGGEPSDPRMN